MTGASTTDLPKPGGWSAQGTEIRSTCGSSTPTAPGNKGRGGGGVTVLPEDDLLGLVGQHPDAEGRETVDRRIGARAGTRLRAGTSARYREGCRCHHVDGDLRQVPGQDLSHGRGQGDLDEKPVLLPPNGEPVVKPAQVVEKYVYNGGFFTRYVGGGKSEWVESKADGSMQFRFAEIGRDKEWIRLFDSSRDMVLRLPVGGGTCAWSTDDGKTWNALYHVDKAK